MDQGTCPDRARQGPPRLTHFATSPIWGETEITAADQARFFLHIDSYVIARHRAYAMTLLAGIVPSERWGIGEIAPRGWKLHFKGGWGYDTGLLDHQVALLVRGCARVSIAVLSMYDGSHPYGKATHRGSSNACSADSPSITLDPHTRGVAQPG